mmetsp:Transcript_5530/g.8248  ORF Transcript_5530/g.8248 Transcript_5530/m.8248 type:complete len:205 (+) Transcript_5530:568-1182(+)|eukprot:CAMPEP_0202428354 /NCGR_PEP_ID=MMETSP1345-20130828/2379_1 /ASSEMBLY_ACC=CAM_ASM_000843 /TAXON_ID=342563 /ORGANISM="Fabrea Fabrea salina" /LENGTH=204 /DNA_ID=CAMNT_0049039319 /DNA_START=488 /DNA_END=1102 /DNA_ORIENTATION=+
MAQVIDTPPLDEEEVQYIYEWVDEIPLSRPKRNITRDFADGCMMAEIVKTYFPRLVELHNYPKAHSYSQKLSNWNTLNTKVFKKLGFLLSKQDIENVINCVPDAIERVLKGIRDTLEVCKERKVDPLNVPKVKERVQNLSKPKGSPERNEKEVSQAVMQEKDQVIQDLRDTIEILENKISKLEQLVKLKDNKINILQNKISQYE